MLQHGSATTDAVPGLEELRRLESPSRLARRGYTSTSGTDIHRKNQEWQAERDLKLQQKREALRMRSEVRMIDSWSCNLKLCSDLLADAGCTES